MSSTGARRKGRADKGTCIKMNVVTKTNLFAREPKKRELWKVAKTSQIVKGEKRKGKLTRGKRPRKSTIPLSATDGTTTGEETMKEENVLSCARLKADSGVQTEKGHRAPSRRTAKQGNHTASPVPSWTAGWGGCVPGPSVICEDQPPPVGPLCWPRVGQHRSCLKHREKG